MINDPYLQPRSSISENLDSTHLLEVNGLCPLCGKYLLNNKTTKKGTIINKQYEIAHLYPNSPTKAELLELKDVERLGKTSEDFENKIALCKDCHWEYDDHKTKEEYCNLLNIKKVLLKINTSKISISHQDIEDGIENIINSFNNIAAQELKKLNYTALKISSKIEDEYLLTRNKIENYVVLYFKFIKEKFQNLDNAGTINFNLIASQIKTSFLDCEKNLNDKSKIFSILVDWLHSKNNNFKIESCEAIISFFVQNCEVFHEITK